MTDWLSFEQILGYIASALLITGYAIKTDVKTKTVLVFSSILFAFHFFLLGAFTAAAICSINAMRNISSIFFHKSIKVFTIFIDAYIISGYFTYNMFIDILPLIAATLTCVGMFLSGGLRFRILVIIACVLWIIHNSYVGSIGGTINSIILLFISVITVIRLNSDRKKERL